MKELNGKEVADFIKERQAKAVRSLVQSEKITPRLVIIRTNPSPVTDLYLRIKQNYGQDIGVLVDMAEVKEANAVAKIHELNADPGVHGIIVQLPLCDATHTDEIINAVEANKDVDGLAGKSVYDSPTPVAINWLLAAHNISLPGKNIVIVGRGRLVGEPLQKIWQASGLGVVVIDETTPEPDALIKQADIIVAAAGVPGVVKSSALKPGAVVVDAGVSTDSGELKGDVEPSARQREDITITPIKGGVGPLTVCALFENVITAARKAN